MTILFLQTAPSRQEIVRAAKIFSSRQRAIAAIYWHISCEKAEVALEDAEGVQAWAELIDTGGPEGFAEYRDICAELSSIRAGESYRTGILTCVDDYYFI